jgi:hypothetical protein
MDKLKSKHLSDLHFEHELWAMEVKFYREELKLYQKWLEEVASKNTHEDVLKQVEHFQNQFLIQKNQLNVLKHQVKAHEHWLAGYAASHPVAIDHVAFADHAAMRENVETAKKLFADLKLEFKRFLDKIM